MQSNTFAMQSNAFDAAIALANFVSTLDASMRAAAPRTDEPRAAWNPRSPFKLLLRSIVDRWPHNLAHSKSGQAVQQMLRTIVRVRDSTAALALLPRLSSKAVYDVIRETSSKSTSLVTLALTRLGWSPFGIALGRTVAAALQVGPAVPLLPCDLASAAYSALAFLRSVSSVDGALDGGEPTTAAMAVMQPVVVPVMEVAIGRRRVQASPLSDQGCANVVVFLHDRCVGRVFGNDASSIFSEWAQFAASAAGKAMYPVKSIVCILQAVLSGSRPLNFPLSSIDLVLGALVSAETARLSQPVPPVSWVRTPLCSSSCSKNADGPSSCARVNDFLTDPARQVAVFSFTNLTKLKHVSGILRYPTSYRVEVVDRQVKITKLQDARTDAAQAATVAQRGTDQAMLVQLADLHKKCAYAINAGAGAGSSGKPRPAPAISSAPSKPPPVAVPSSVPALAAGVVRPVSKPLLMVPNSSVARSLVPASSAPVEPEPRRAASIAHAASVNPSQSLQAPLAPPPAVIEISDSDSD